MASSPCFCILFLLSSWKLLSACSEDSNCRILAFPAPFFFDHKRLVNHTIRTEDGVDFDMCQLLCYHEANCVSINYDLNTQICELNNATHRGHDNEFVDKSGFLYHGANSTCDVFKCKNDGSCQSGFTDKQYRCLCLPGFSGEQCEEVMMDSVIISNNGIFLYHLAQFLAPVVGNNSQWKLCYRASIHGKYDVNFHMKCDGKNNTVTIVKKNEYVFGGFTDIPWEGIKSQGHYRETSKAFIFSLRNKEKLGPFKGMVKEPSKAIYNHIHMGPKFGKKDISINQPGNHSTTQLNSSYSVPSNVQDSQTVLAGTHQFEPDELEVFYLDHF